MIALQTRFRSNQRRVLGVIAIALATATQQILAHYFGDHHNVDFARGIIFGVGFGIMILSFKKSEH